MKVWNWEGSIDELLDYWFQGEKEMDERILQTIKIMREKGIKCYLASDQEKYRAEFLLRDLGMEKLFDGHFFPAKWIAPNLKESFLKRSFKN